MSKKIAYEERRNCNRSQESTPFEWTEHCMVFCKGPAVDQIIQAVTMREHGTSITKHAFNWLLSYLERFLPPRRPGIVGL